MFYIDDYNSKTITNTPPKKEQKLEEAKAKLEMTSKQLAVFWYVSGITIAHSFEAVKTLLEKYGYKVVNEEDAAAAIADMLGTDKWTKFVKEFAEIIENTVDERVFQEYKTSSEEESGFVAALIAAIGAVAGGTLGLISSSKQKQAAKESAKAQMFSGISAAVAERQKQKTEQEISKREQKRNVMWIVIISFLVLGTIIGIVIYKRNKAKAV